jgi:hypothetical protein
VIFSLRFTNSFRYTIYMNTVVVTPAGREKYLKKLVEHLRLQKDSFDEWHLWVNTKNENDINYMKNLECQYKWIKLIYRTSKKLGTNQAIHLFFDYTIDVNTIYIRLDDDIVWMEDDFIKKLVKFRKENRQYFLVYANIVNNNVIDHIHQRLGVLSDIPFIEYKCTGNAWKSSEISQAVHKKFIQARNEQTTHNWKFSKWELRLCERVSINAISWIGGSFKNFGKIVGKDEEVWLSCTYPKQVQAINVVYGDALCVHHSFRTQREKVNNISVDEMIDEISAI